MKPPRRALGNSAPGRVLCLAGGPVSPRCHCSSSYCGLLCDKFQVGFGGASASGASTNPGT